jgi:hypothetical protein
LFDFLAEFFDIVGFWRGGEEVEEDVGGCEGGSVDCSEV